MESLMHKTDSITISESFALGEPILEEVEAEYRTNQAFLRVQKRPYTYNRSRDRYKKNYNTILVPIIYENTSTI